MSPYSLRLFGLPALLNADGTQIPLRTRKHVALLVYLTLDGVDRATPREHLTELFWPGVPWERGRHSLAQALSAIRRCLGAPVLHRLGRTVVFVARVPTDLEALEHGGTVPVELQHPLRGLDHLAGSSFEHWLDATRERLRRRARDALARQLEIARSNGDGAAVHERAVHLYRADPMSDTAVQALCERMLNEGDAATGAALLRRHMQRGQEATGKPPRPELKRLLHLMERGHLATRRVDRTAPRASRYRPPEVFIGRTSQLSRLERQWTDVPKAGRRTCLVVGPAGMGKSSLLSRFSTSVASRSGIVWEVTCQEIGRNIPFATVSDFILALAQYPGAGATDARWLAEASRVAPGVRTWHSGIPDPPPVPADAVRLRVAEALVRIIEVVGDDGTMLLVLDDLEYLDPASRDILHLLFRRLERARLLIVGSARYAGDQTLVLQEPDGARGLRWDDVVTLVPLAPEHVREMVAGLCSPGPVPGPAILDTMVELAQGNPYLVEMLLSDWRRQPEEALVSVYRRGDDAASRWRPPATMDKAFERQHRGLSAEADRVLSLLAVAGRRLPARDVGDLLGLAGGAADAAAMQLLDRGIVRVEEGGLQIKNQLHRSYVYHAMAEDTRRYLHGKVAEMLASTVPGIRFQALLAASHHFLQAGILSRAILSAREGANEAIDRGGASEAEHVLRSVCTLGPSHDEPSLVLLLGRCLAAQGRHAEALPLLETLPADLLDVDEQSMTALVLAESLHRARLASDSVIEGAIDKALALATNTGLKSQVLHALQLSIEFRSECGEPLDRQLQMAREIASGSDDIEDKAMASMSTGYCSLVQGDASNAERRFAYAAKTFRKTSREIEFRRALNGLAISQMAVGNYTHARSNFERAAHTAQKTGDLDGAANSWSNLGALLDDLGYPELAVEPYETALENTIKTGNRRRLGELALNLAGLALSLGDFECAEQLLHSLLQLALASGQWRLKVDALYAKADLAVGMGDLPTAWKLLEEAESVRLSRLYRLTDMGRFERLRRYYAWHATERSPNTPSTNGFARRYRCVLVADLLEAEALDEWIAWRSGQLSAWQAKSTRQLEQLGLWGVLNWLQRLGTLVEMDTSRRQPEMASRRPDPDACASAAAKCRSLAELLHSDRTRQPVLGQTVYLSSA